MNKLTNLHPQTGIEHIISHIINSPHLPEIIAKLNVIHGIYREDSIFDLYAKIYCSTTNCIQFGGEIKWLNNINNGQNGKLMLTANQK